MVLHPKSGTCILTKVDTLLDHHNNIQGSLTIEILYGSNFEGENFYSQIAWAIAQSTKKFNATTHA